MQRWLKALGDPVAADEPLVELETDKVTVEIAAPAAGSLLQILAPEQTAVSPGDLLATIAVSDGAAPPTPAVDRSVGTAPGAGPPDPASSLSPAVRRLLAERGLTAADVRGTGSGGRITADDVLATPVREDAPATQGGVRLVPHTPMRRRIAERMVESLRVAPHVTTVFEADMAAVLAHRARHGAEFERSGAPLTLTAYVLQACVAAIRAVPEVNSRWTDAALELHDAMHVGVATALYDGGLVVPVVHDLQSLDLFGIARELRALVARAREGALTPADVRGGTFTVSNHGVSGSLVATPIVIHQPQAAILGVGKLERRAVAMAVDGEERIVARPRCYVTLTIDHRVMDGQRANRFLEVLVRGLEQVSN